MSMFDYGPRTDAEESSDNARFEARQRGEARCDLQVLAGEIGEVLRGLDLSNHKISCISEILCEQLLDHQTYSAALNWEGNGPDGYAIAEGAMIRAAAKQEAA